MLYSIFSKSYKSMLLLIGILTLPNILFSQGTANKGESKNAAFLFAYYPKEGMKSHFENGYKRHLNWHKQKNDNLVWYAWYVASGNRLGLFIDGTFGISFADFDNRVDLQGDGADFAQTTAPFVEPEFRSVYILREDLSTGKLLEEWKPSTTVQVHLYVVTIGKEQAFEKLLMDIKEYSNKQTKPPVLTWYRLIDGGENSGYMLMMPKHSWADYDSPYNTLSSFIERIYGKEATQHLETLAAMIKSKYSETWRYREDLSYFPNKE